MQLLLTTTKVAAQALAAKALLYAQNEQGAIGTAWSPVYTNGSQFGITFESSILAAFTTTELGASTVGSGASAVTTYSKIIEGELKQTDPGGVVTGVWEIAP